MMNMEDQSPLNEQQNEPEKLTDLQNEKKVIPVIEEQLHISKEWKETGRVLISKTVAEEEVNYQVPVQQEELVIERKEINQYVDEAPPATRYEGNTTIVSVLKEVLVVEKKLLLVEEVHITKRKTENVVSGTETLRKEEVNITKKDIEEP
jgi:uncharacterized protein (TIGR02271 family)